jgi:hypothetical protein
MHKSGFALWSACGKRSAAPLWYFAVKRKRGGEWVPWGIGLVFRLGGARRNTPPLRGTPLEKRGISGIDKVYPATQNR